MSDQKKSAIEKKDGINFMFSFWITTSFGKLEGSPVSCKSFSEIVLEISYPTKAVRSLSSKSQVWSETNLTSTKNMAIVRQVTKS